LTCSEKERVQHLLSYVNRAKQGNLDSKKSFTATVVLARPSAFSDEEGSSITTGTGRYVPYEELNN
jgi:hypothetical protein